jgi:hypothetical protein
MSRRVILAGLCGTVFAVAFDFSQISRAQAQAVASADDCWISVATGRSVETVPLSVAGHYRHDFKFVSDAAKKGEVSIPGVGSFSRNPDGSWISVATGRSVETVPLSVAGHYRHDFKFVSDAAKKGEVSIPGVGSFSRVPCPPPSTVSGGTQVGMSGGYFGGEIIKNGARVKSKETSAATGAVTNQFSDDGDPIGGGVVAGWNFALANNWIVGPFASFDWLRQTVNHTFPAGFYLGTTTNWIANLGGRAGYLVTPDWQIYGLAGAAWLNESLNINFPAGFSTKNATVPGFTLGLGTEYQPASWAVAGHPISLFAQYQHTWYADATFTMPTPASPGFNYAFRRDDDTLKVGVIVHLSPPAPPPPPLIHK